MKIRTITCGLNPDFRHWREAEESLTRSVNILKKAQQLSEATGYEVQTLRLSLPPFLPDLNETERRKILAELGEFCITHQLSFVSLGALRAGQLPVTEVVDILARYPALNFSTIIAEQGKILAEGVHEAAQIINRLATATPDGLCNFRYCAIASCPPGIPFFPASYHQGEIATLALGMQMPDVALEVISRSAAQIAKEGPNAISLALSRAIIEKLQPLEELIGEFCNSQESLSYTGIDVSLAPMAEDSVAAAIEAAGLGRFGESGTLAVAAAITEGLRQVGKPADPEQPVLRTTGYNGLMLPVLEDALIGQRAVEGLVDIQKLLMYSAVCGTGLDVVPIPGTTGEEAIARLLFDVAALSARYNKPLSARLFPVPGKAAGEHTEFDSPYLTNTKVMSI
jgi:uncharacterized protein (UPF0210 family)